MSTPVQPIQSSQTLAQMVRAKYPGAYDDMDDTTLENNVLAKYPQYSDLPRSAAPDPLKTGAGMGAGNTIDPTNQNFMARQVAQTGPSGERLGGTQPTDPAAIQQRRDRTAKYGGALASALMAAPTVGGFGSAVEAGGMRAALPWLARTVIGTGAGSAIGGEAGERVGGWIGPEGKEIGGKLGSLAGGALGGGMASALERNPTTSLQSLRADFGKGAPGSIRALPMGIQRLLPEWTVPAGELGSPNNAGPFLPIKQVIKPPTPELGSPENPGWLAKLPNRVPKPPSQSANSFTVSMTPPDQAFIPRTSEPPVTSLAQRQAQVGQARAIVGRTGRIGSAGDLASWKEGDLWNGYMANQGTPLGDAIKGEIQRRGLAASEQTSVRLPFLRNQ